MNAKADKPDRSVATSLRKALAILEEVADADGPLTGQQIAVQVGLSRSTASRLALDLCELGYLAPLSNGQGFELGTAALRLGLRKFSSIDIRRVAAPFMRTISDNTGLMVDLALAHGDEMLYFEVSRKSGSVVLATELGSRMPIEKTAGGLAAISAFMPLEREQVLARLKMKYGADWPQVEARIQRAMEEIATYGFCTAIGTWRPDVSAVGLPFIDPRTGRTFSFSCSGIGYTIEEDRLRKEIGPRMVELVHNVASAMGTAPRP